MTEQEATKINDLYKQIDLLTVENTTLKSTQSNSSTDLTPVLTRLESIEDSLKTLSKWAVNCSLKYLLQSGNLYASKIAHATSI